MTRGKKLGILCGVLAVVLIGIVLVNAQVKRNEGQGSAAASETVLSIPTDEITELSWNNGTEELHFVKHGDTWVNPEDDSVPVDSELLETMTGNLSDIQSYKNISGNDNMGDYGLEPAVLDIHIKADREYRILLGNENELDGQVYASVDNGKVFLTDSILKYQFSRSSMDLVLKETIPEMDEILSVEIRLGDRTLALEYDDSGERSYSDKYVWFGSEGNSSVSLDTEKVHQIVQTIQAIQWNSTAAVHADSSDLSAYGLDHPEAEVTVEYSEGETDRKRFLLDIGHTLDDGTCYAMIRGSDRVYVAASPLHEKITGITLQNLQPTEILAMNWESVKSMSMVLDGTSYNFIPETGTESEDSEENSQVWKWTEEDKTCVLTEALKNLESLQGETKETGDPGKEVFSLTLERNTANYPQVTLIVSELDDNYYSVTFNGDNRLKVSREEMDTVLDMFREVLE